MCKIPEGSLSNILKNNDHLYSKLKCTRNAVKPILEDSKMIHFTKHDVKHSDRVVEKLSILAEYLDVHLVEEECYILLSAAYLHDIGMQSDKFKDTKKTRNMHHILSSEMILGSINNNDEYPNLEIDKNFCNSIALISKAHRKIDIINNTKYDDFVMGGSLIRFRLLAALLRFADELDIDFRRVNIERLKIEKNMSAESKLHWYKHYYVLGVGINQGMIRLTYRFPEEYMNTNTEKMIIKFTKERILEEYEYFREDIFWNAGIKLSLGKEDKKYDETIKPLPKAQVNVLKNIIRFEEIPNYLSDWNIFRNKCGTNVRDTISKIIGIRYLRDIYVNRNIEDDFENFQKSDKQLFILIGRPGSGKTNLTCELSQNYSPSIFLPLLERLPEEDEMEKFIKNSIGHDTELPFDIMIEQINTLCITNSEIFNIFIDGELYVNELFQPNTWLHQFLKTYKGRNIKIMISCRGDLPFTAKSNYIAKYIYVQNFGPLSDMNISGVLTDFNESEYEEALNRYFDKFKINIHGGIKDDAFDRLKHPYLLRLFSESYKEETIHGPIRDIRYIELCDNYWAKVYETVLTKCRDIDVHDFKTNLLRFVRFMRKNWMNTCEYNNFAINIGEDSFEFLKKEGVISTSNGENSIDSQYCFSFEEFQEYLMAQQILTEYDLLNSDQNLVIQQITNIIGKSDELRFRFGLGLIEFSILLLEKLRTDKLYARILLYIAENNEKQWRNLACRCISKLVNIDENIVEVLSKLCSDREIEVLRNLAEILGMISSKNPEESEKLLTCLMDNRDEIVLIRIALSFLRFNERKADLIIPKILDILKDHRWRISAAIAVAISDVDWENKKLLIPIIDALKAKGDSNTLTSLAQSLSNIGLKLAPYSISVLHGIAKEGEGLHKSEAIASLARLASYDVDEITEIFNELKTNKDYNVRLAVTQNVNQINKNFALKIWEELSKDEDIFVRLSVYNKLLENGIISKSDIDKFLKK